jgi:hypothetical protein
MTLVIMAAVKYDQMKVQIVIYGIVNVVYGDFAIIFEAFILNSQNSICLDYFQQINSNNVLLCHL